MTQLVRAAILCALLATLARTDADPDLWGHLLGGRDIVATGGTLTHDPYSFTSDRPWINHNWLGEVALWEAWRHGGPAGLVALKLVVVGAVFALVGVALARAGVPGPYLELLLLAWVAGVAAVTKTVRPQIFSLLAFTVLLAILVAAPRRARTLLAVPALLALWANVHGGWTVGAGVLGVWAAARLVSADEEPPRGATLAVALGGIAATLATPYGTALWRFMAETVPGGHTDIGEWRSIADAGAARVAVVAGLAAIAAAAMLRGRPRPSTFVVVTVGGLAVATWRTARLQAFFATAILVLLAPQLASLAGRRTPSARRPGHLVLATVGGLALAALLTGTRDIVRSAGCLRVVGRWTPDMEAAAFIGANDVRGRMITWFDWGEYAMWHFGPRVVVSMDPRRETVYSDATLAAHRALYDATPEGLALLDRLDADWAWLPRRLPVVAHLVPPRWHVVFESPRSVVAARAPGTYVAPPPTPATPRCFPAAP